LASIYFHRFYLSHLLNNKITNLYDFYWLNLWHRCIILKVAPSTLLERPVSETTTPSINESIPLTTPATQTRFGIRRLQPTAPATVVEWSPFSPDKKSNKNSAKSPLLTPPPSFELSRQCGQQTRGRRSYEDRSVDRDVHGNIVGGSRDLSGSYDEGRESQSSAVREALDVMRLTQEAMRWGRAQSDDHEVVIGGRYLSQVLNVVSVKMIFFKLSPKSKVERTSECS
jgi:hypothetical protein